MTGFVLHHFLYYIVAAAPIWSFRSHPAHNVQILTVFIIIRSICRTQEQLYYTCVTVLKRNFDSPIFLLKSSSTYILPLLSLVLPQTHLKSVALIFFSIHIRDSNFTCGSRNSPSTSPEQRLFRTSIYTADVDKIHLIK